MDFTPLGETGGALPVEGLRADLAALRAEVVAAGAAGLGGVHPAFAPSARNLLGYLALRRRDLRPLQTRLARRGLSSLGWAEAHVGATLDAVLTALAALDGDAWAPPEDPPVSFDAGDRALARHTAALFGAAPPGRETRVMVTLPSEAAADPGLVRQLIEAGMDAARINCAHDDAEAWARMAENVGRAAREVGRPCRVVMDLAGPKIRTGPIEPGPRVVKVKPRRDALGRVTVPGRAWLTSPGAPSPPDLPAVLPVPATWLATLREGGGLRLRDARGRKRRWVVRGGGDRGRWIETDQTAYVTPGTRLEREGADEPGAPVGDLPALEGRVRLAVDDLLVLTPGETPGRAAVRDGEGRTVEPARIGCTAPEVLNDLRPGEAVWFDDGAIGGRAEAVGPDGVTVRVTHARAGGRWLRADKGINLPDTDLRLPALTQKDRADLAVVARLADVVGLSFVRGADDVAALHDALAEEVEDGVVPAVLVKIETRRGFAALPEILLAAMRAPACGVMIARGDLAVECGFERLAEVQEEVLWVCEAAHVPVVWATQVLEGLAKTGAPSRAEVTDAAMGHRAECVMLNKGPHVADAVTMLDDILRRMSAHQSKKRAALRALSLAGACAPR